MALPTKHDLIYYSVILLILLSSCVPTTTVQKRKGLITLENDQLDPNHIVPRKNFIMPSPEYKGKKLRDLELLVPLYAHRKFEALEVLTPSEKAIKDSIGIRKRLFSSLVTNGAFSRLSIYPEQIEGELEERKFKISAAETFSKMLPVDGGKIVVSSEAPVILLLDELIIVEVESEHNPTPHKPASEPRSMYTNPYNTPLQQLYIVNFVFWDNTVGKIISFGRVKANKPELLGDLILSKSPFRK